LWRGDFVRVRHPAWRRRPIHRRAGLVASTAEPRDKVRGQTHCIAPPWRRGAGAQRLVDVAAGLRSRGPGHRFGVSRVPEGVGPAARLVAEGAEQRSVGGGRHGARSEILAGGGGREGGAAPAAERAAPGGERSEEAADRRAPFGGEVAPGAPAKALPRGLREAGRVLAPTARRRGAPKEGAPCPALPGRRLAAPS